VLIDSGAGTTVIRKHFAKDLVLDGKRERIDLAVVGGEKLEQPHSRRVNFWISALKGDQEFKIEVHEIEKTILNVPELDRKWLSSFPHLQDIEFNHVSSSIDLILGVHYTHLHSEEEIRHGEFSVRKVTHELKGVKLSQTILLTCKLFQRASLAMILIALSGDIELNPGFKFLNDIKKNTG
jgi:hypothetical protein